MKNAGKGRVFVRGALFFAAICVIAAVYALLGSIRQSSADLCDTFDERHGWTYEVVSGGEARSFEPVFSADSYGMNALDDDCRAVRISRVMTEAFESAQLAFYAYEEGIEVALDGETLYSDFGALSRDSRGFLTVGESDFTARMSEFRTLRFSLPAEYEGKTLTVVTYFPKTVAGERLPVYPIVETEWAAGGVVVETVKPVTAMTLFAIMAVLLLAMFLVDGTSDRLDLSFAFLACYFFMLFISRAYTSLPGIYSKLQAFWPLGVAEHIYPTFLYMALATRLGGWRKWGLFSASVAQIVFTVCITVGSYARVGFICSDNGKSAAALLVLSLVFAAFERAPRRNLTRKGQRLVAAAVVVTVAALYAAFDSRRHDLPLNLYFQNIFDSAWEFGNLLPFVLPISAITAYSLSILLVWLFISRTLDRQRAHLAIAERSRLTLEHYQTLLDLEEKDRALRHEMNHHLSAISAFLESGECERARAYVGSVSQQARDTRPDVLSRNLLVSAIVGRYFKSAKDAGITCCAHVIVPAEVHIADEDLCVYLTNLLENALEACKRCGDDAERHIRFSMEKQGNFIYIGCKNSTPAEVMINEDGLPETTKKKPGRHGYGMLAMRRVAEKYNSVLLIRQTPCEFSVMTNLLDQ